MDLHIGNKMEVFDIENKIQLLVVAFLTNY